MIYRLWSTGVHAAQLSRYREFAEQRSLPMFLQQPGFRGLAFLQSGHEHLVLSAWDGIDDVVRLGESDSYRRTAAALSALGVLSGSQDVRILSPEILTAPTVPISVGLTSMQLTPQTVDPAEA
jgi:heme-degrading monooxygenase HmoA